MSNVISLAQWQNKTTQVIEIPGMEGDKIGIKVRKPRIMAMASQGKIPNPLMGIATKLVGGKGAEQGNLKEMAQMIELYCQVCMVEPTYDDVRDVISDDQMFAIFSWAISGVTEMANFRKKEEAVTSNSDGGEVSKETERDISH